MCGVRMGASRRKAGVARETLNTCGPARTFAQSSRLCSMMSPSFLLLIPMCL